MLEKFRSEIPKHVYEWLDFACTKYGIDNDIKICHFLSQIKHESADFYHMVENLNYTRAGLLKVFPKYFNENNVMHYVKNPIAIANRVYANRMGNGNENTGDGWKYKGRGFIQLTGKYNYEKASKGVGEDFVNNPELLITDKYASIVAGWYFNPIAKKMDKMTVEQVTRFVNGGLNGLEDRKKIYDSLIKLVNFDKK